jgi:hypothetical protein
VVRQLAAARPLDDRLLEPADFDHQSPIAGSLTYRQSINNPQSALANQSPINTPNQQSAIRRFAIRNHQSAIRR